MASIDPRVIQLTMALRKAATAWTARQNPTDLLTPSQSADGVWLLLMQSLDSVNRVEHNTEQPAKAVFTPIDKVLELTGGFMPTLRFVKTYQVVVAAIVCGVQDVALASGSAAGSPVGGGSDNTFHAFFVMTVGAAPSPFAHPSSGGHGDDDEPVADDEDDRRVVRRRRREE